MSGSEGVIEDSPAVGRDRAYVGCQAELSLFRASLAGEARACPVHHLGRTAVPTPVLAGSRPRWSG
ncbi:hypothetical protein G5C60_26200 [Streptomyces sp. HC44]|uniref:Uncharacterized protein n=1 Tax=Streptomyces scabichelini TaxID=2711217 RepID=A0A6G4VA49_9ACTN|nr:hypothetical protein [Streptomyces scabichelini]NGO10998.1 hypothetical protein [Streptomyces scabichelini]